MARDCVQRAKRFAGRSRPNNGGRQLTASQWDQKRPDGQAQGGTSEENDGHAHCTSATEPQLVLRSATSAPPTETPAAWRIGPTTPFSTEPDSVPTDQRAGR